MTVFVDSLGSIKKSDEPALYNSRVLNNFIEYVKKDYPELNINRLLEEARISLYEMSDPAHWFTQSQVNTFYNVLANKTGDSSIARKVGRFSSTSETSGTVRHYGLGFITPASVYWAFEKLSSKFTRAVKIEIKKVGPKKVEIITKPYPGVKEEAFQCENRIGWLESITLPFINKFAYVQHPKCLHKGNDCCQYIITWEESPAVLLKRIRNYLHLGSLLLFIVLTFFTPFLTWLIISLSLSLLNLIFSMVVDQFEKNDLVQKIERQGDTANVLLEEMNIRYNHAMLVQEIGQVTSTIRDVKRLIGSVVKIMKNRLDFDRGMILLADEEKNRLIFISGFGYQKEFENLLFSTVFNLENPKSRGHFVSAFKEQKPFLVNDTSEIEKNASQKSWEFAKKLGVQSMICVPIVYENESLGVLAVDNIKTKRPLTQSDVSLLLGVASETAVSIINARSYQKLRESENKYRDLVENANSIILRWNTEGVITFFNEFAQKFFGYSEDEVIGRNIVGSIILGSKESQGRIDQLLSTFKDYPEQIVNDVENIMIKGKSVWIAWTYKPIFDSAGKLIEILSIGNDITELKKTSEEKESLIVQLQGAQKMEAIGTLAGGIAHDFNNILQAIIGYTQILLLGKGKSDPDFSKLEAIELSAQRATDLTQRLLIFSRKVESRLKPIDLNQNIVQVVSMLERTIPKMIKIDIKLEEGIHIINADPVQIEQVLMNLGVNARDAMPEGGTLSFETSNVYIDDDRSKKNVDCKPGDYLLLKVSDTGEGIDPKYLDRVFEPFFTTKETGKGTGLGLAVVYGIVKNHHGFIQCESRRGRGTSFKIYFPIITYIPKSREEKKVKVPIKGGNETILLVDDEEPIRDSGRQVLSSFGYKVITAEDGEKAIGIYEHEKKKVDLIILDLIMPGMGGRRCLEKLMQIDPEAKVVIASGYSIDENTKGIIEDLARGFISKPYDMQQVLYVVREVLERN